MPSLYENPYAYVVIGDMVLNYKFMESPPVFWPIIASDMNLDPDTNIDGRYVSASSGQVEGTELPKQQDTTLASGRDTGRTFNVVAGDWKDDYVNTVTNTYGLLCASSVSGATFDINTATTTDQIEDADITIRRGWAGAGAPRTAADFNTYIQLAYGSQVDYRIALEWGNPIRLDRTEDTGSTWKQGIAICRDLGNVVKYSSMINTQFTFRVRADAAYGTLQIEVGTGDYMSYSEPAPINEYGVLGSPGNIRISGINGSISVSYFPIRYQPITVKGNIDVGNQNTNGQNAFMTGGNGLATPSPDQTGDSTVSTDDNQSYDWTVTAQNPDAGDGLGSIDPPILANALMVIPAVWVDQLSVPPIPTQQLQNRTVTELQLFDDSTRCATSSAVVVCDNQYGQYNGTYGHAAISIRAGIRGIGGPLFQRFIGIAGEDMNGIDISTIQTWGRMVLPCQGREAAMNKAAGIRRVYDGWCLFSAVAAEAELGNCHPSFLSGNIPFYLPPNAPPNAPYGEADNSCPYPILASGSGLNARYDFGPEVAPWTVLQILAQQSGYIDPTTGLSIPYYMGWQNDGYFHFEPYDPTQLTPVATYVDAVGYPGHYQGGGLQEIDGEIHVYNSVANMRTDVQFQGIDPWTYELLVASLSMSDAVKAAIGYHYPWLERNARYSGQYLAQMVNIAAAIASRPQQVLKFKAPFNPILQAGDVIYVQSARSLSGAGTYVVIELQSRYGMEDDYGNSGNRVASQIITCRSTREYPRTNWFA